MPTIDELKVALFNADKAGDYDAARKLAAVIGRAESDGIILPPDSPVFESEPSETRPDNIGVLDQVAAIPETAAAMATGATAGAAGYVTASAQEIARQILSGEIGTQEAAQLAAQFAAQRAQNWSYQPRGEVSQRQVETIGEALGALPPVAAVALPAGAISAAAAPARAVAQSAPAIAAAAKQNIIDPASRAIAGEDAAPISDMARSVGAEQVDAARRRAAIASGLPVPVSSMTKGELYRDADQLAFEKEQMKTDLGGSLRDAAEEKNIQILENFDVLEDEFDPKFKTLYGVGDAVIKTLRQGAAEAKAAVREKYKAAELAGDMEDPVTLEQTVNYLNENRSERDLAPVVGAAIRKAIDTGVAGIDSETGLLVAQPVSLKTAEGFRKTAGQVSNNPDSFHSSRIKKIFDAETEGAGGDLYKAARRENAKMARKYENRAIVARLLKNKRGLSDPIVATDQVFRKSILNASPEEIRFLKRVLLVSGNDGRDAWKELQAATVRHIKREASEKTLGMDSNDVRTVSTAKLVGAVRALDENERLDEILGKKNASIVRDIALVAEYVTTVPPGTLINTSGTAATLTAALGEMAVSGLAAGVPVPVLTAIKSISSEIKKNKTKAKIAESLNAMQKLAEQEKNK